MASVRLRWRLLRELDDWLDWPMAILSLVWLGVVVWELVSGTTALLETVGLVIWLIFIVEFAVRLALAPDKSAFLRSNWLTLAALIVPPLRLFRALSVFRAAQVLRSLRLVRIVGTANRSMNALKATLRRRGFVYVAGLTLLVTTLGAAGMLNFENARHVDGGFASFGDALWWTGMLLTTIGSEYWPVTTEGRVLAMLLSIYGLAVLGYIAATFASFFIGRDAEEPSGPVAGAAELDALVREVRALRAELRAQAGTPA